MKTITHEEVQKIILSHNALVKTVRTSVKDRLLWEYIINQIADPVNNRPLKSVDESLIDRSYKWNSLEQSWEKSAASQKKRGAKKHTRFSKKMACTLAPMNGQIKLYEYGLGESVGLIMDIGKAKVKPKYIFPKTVNSDRKPWLKRKKSSQNIHTDLQAISIKELRKLQNISTKENGVARTNEILASISSDSLVGVFATKNQLIYRIASIGMQQLVMQKLNREVPLFIHSPTKGFSVYSLQQQLEDVITAAGLPPQSIIHQYLKFINTSTLLEQLNHNSATISEHLKQAFEKLVKTCRDFIVPYFHTATPESKTIVMQESQKKINNPKKFLELINNEFKLFKYYSRDIATLLQNNNITDVVLTALNYKSTNKIGVGLELEDALRHLYFNLLRYDTSRRNVPLIEHLHAFVNTQSDNYCPIYINRDVMRSEGEETYYVNTVQARVDISGLAIASLSNPEILTTIHTLYSTNDIEHDLRQLDYFLKIDQPYYDYSFQYDRSIINLNYYSNHIMKARARLILLLPENHNYLLSSKDKSQILQKKEAQFSTMRSIENIEDYYKKITHSSLYTQQRNKRYDSFISFFTNQRRKSATAGKIDHLYTKYLQKIKSKQSIFLQQCHDQLNLAESHSELNDIASNIRKDNQYKLSLSTRDVIEQLLTERRKEIFTMASVKTFNMDSSSRLPIAYASPLFQGMSNWKDSPKQKNDIHNSDNDLGPCKPSAPPMEESKSHHWEGKPTL
jgi:hypothetical protein